MIKLVLNSTFEIDGLDPNSEFAITLQEASFETLTERGSSFSNLVEFAKTARNVGFFGPVDSLNFTGSAPYRLYDCDVYDQDLLVFSGVFKLMETNHTFKGRVFGAAAGLFDLLKGVKINELDLSALNHTWTADNVNDNRQRTSGYVYPNINYGRFTGQTHAASGVQHTNFFPAVFVDDILDAACTLAGYSYTPSGNNRIIPFSRQNFEASNSLVARTITTGDVVYSLTAGNANQGINFAVSTDPLSVTAFSAGLGRYIILNKGTVRLTGSVDYSNSAGGTAVMELYNDTTSVVYQSVTIAPSSSGTFSFDLEVQNTSTTPNNIQIRLLRVLSDTDVSISAGSTFNLESGTRQIVSGNIIPIADTLPDIDVIELFKYEATKENALMLADNKAKTFEFVRFDDIAARFGEAINWDEKVVNDNEVRLLFHIDEYGQNNYLDYKVQPEADPSRDPQQIGRGNLTVDDTTLERAKTFYTAPFCRSGNFEGFSNKGAMIFIPRYSDPTLDYREPDIDPTPRILENVIDASLSITVNGTSPPATQSNPIFQGFAQDITDYYGALSTALNRCKVVEVFLQLSNFDIEFFDVTRPVFLLNAYWFVLEIEQFQIGGAQPTKVKLLRLY